MDFLRNSILRFDDYNNFLNSIHLNLRKKIFAKSIIDTKINNIEEISWETKLSLSKVSDKIKIKVTTCNHMYCGSCYKNIKICAFCRGNIENYMLI